MKVTRTGRPCSQLPADESRKGGFLRKNRAELEGYAGPHDSGRIAEKNITKANKEECFSSNYWNIIELNKCSDKWSRNEYED